jgi:hypothetical protein
MPVKTRKQEEEEEAPARDQELEAAYQTHTLVQMLATQLAVRQTWTAGWMR